MVLLTAFAMGAAAKYQADNEGPKPPCFDTEGKEKLDLLPIEKEDHAMLENPIATVTYFDGNPDVAADYLRKRVAKIVKANPWLGGRLHRDENDGTIRLWYDEEGKDMAPGLFRKFSSDELFVAPEMQYKLLCSKIAGKGVKVGRNCDIVGQDEPLWKVSLIPDGVMVGKKFLLVVSMSHAAGDGHTFYKIFHMLDKAAEVKSLNPRRNFQFDAAARSVMGDDGMSYLPNASEKPSLWTNIKREKAHNLIFTVSEKWLKDQRALVPKTSAGDNEDSNGPAQEGLSSNDLIVSWFFRVAGATVGFQICNLRGRIEGEGACLDLDAGNYFRTVPFTAGDYRDPYLLRRSAVMMGGARRAGTNDDGQPTVLPEFSWESRHAVATNWRSLNGDGALSIDGAAVQGRHVPFYDADDIALVPLGVSALIIFAERPGVLGMHVVGSKHVVSAVNSSGIVEKTIASF